MLKNSKMKNNVCIKAKLSMLMYVRIFKELFVLHIHFISRLFIALTINCGTNMRFFVKKYPF